MSRVSENGASTLLPILCMASKSSRQHACASLPLSCMVDFLGNYKTWTLDWIMDWTVDWTQLWTRSLTAKISIELSQST